ncbi:hypothetical protein A2U01_0096786, partial [Trifolium medium]|nr:hypothetical protein [Trifolium medium]
MLNHLGTTCSMDEGE